MLWLADLLAEHGQTDKAVALLRDRVDAGDGFAALWLTDLLVKQDRIDEARPRRRRRPGRRAAHNPDELRTPRSRQSTSLT